MYGKLCTIITVLLIMQSLQSTGVSAQKSGGKSSVSAAEPTEKTPIGLKRPEPESVDQEDSNETAVDSDKNDTTIGPNQDKNDTTTVADSDKTGNESSQELGNNNATETVDSSGNNGTSGATESPTSNNTTTKATGDPEEDPEPAEKNSNNVGMWVAITCGIVTAVLILCILGVWATRSAKSKDYNPVP